MGEPDFETPMFEVVKLVQDWPTPLDVTVACQPTSTGGAVLKPTNRSSPLIWVEYSLRLVWQSRYALCRTTKKEIDQSKPTFHPWRTPSPYHFLPSPLVFRLAILPRRHRAALSTCLLLPHVIIVQQVMSPALCLRSCPDY